MGKRAKAEAPAVEPASAKNVAKAGSEDPAEPFCGICGKDIDCGDEYLAGEQPQWRGECLIRSGVDLFAGRPFLGPALPAM
jgi:hypothetical protein